MNDKFAQEAACLKSEKMRIQSELDKVNERLAYLIMWIEELAAKTSAVSDAMTNWKVAIQKKKSKKG